ncbi:N-acyl-D-glutamate deacylase [subsurface metagenome]
MGMSNGFENRPPTAEELTLMKEIVANAMQAGAIGMSTGLMYSPQGFATKEDVIELAKVVAEYNGIYASHIRSEEDRVVEAVQELIDIVEISGCKGGQISHHKMAGMRNWGKSKVTLQMIADANARGLNIRCDQYPYNRGSSNLRAALPPWVHEGGREQLLERLKNFETRAKIKTSIMEGVENWENWIDLMGFDHLYLSSTDSDIWRDMESKSFAEIATIKGKDAWEIFFQVLIDTEATANITIESMGEEDIKNIMTSPYQMFGTDSVAVPAMEMIGKVHPRTFGTYPRVLAKYVREEKLLIMEDAIRRMTSFPAQHFGLHDRGLIKEGMAADLVIFNAETIRDTATFEDPLHYPEGISYVIVNGQIVINRGEQNQEVFPGKVLRRNK